MVFFGDNGDGNYYAFFFYFSGGVYFVGLGGDDMTERDTRVLIDDVF